MAHFVLEYSTNLDADGLDLQGLFERLIATADATGLFPLKGLRCRAYPCHEYRIADGNPEHGFAHLAFRIGPGRSEADRKAVAGALFDVFCTHFEDQRAGRGLMLSFELSELDPVTRFNRNNVPDYL